MTWNFGSILRCFSLSRTWTEPPKLEVPQQQSDTSATKTKVNFQWWLYFSANWRRFIKTITQLTFLHSQSDAVPENDFPAARPSRTVSALQTKMSHHHIVCKQQHFYTTPRSHAAFIPLLVLNMTRCCSDKWMLNTEVRANNRTATQSWL